MRELYQLFIPCFKDSSTCCRCRRTKPDRMSREREYPSLPKTYQTACSRSLNGRFSASRFWRNSSTILKLSSSPGSKPLESCKTKNGFSLDVNSSSIFASPGSNLETVYGKGKLFGAGNKRKVSSLDQSLPSPLSRIHD